MTPPRGRGRGSPGRSRPGPAIHAPLAGPVRDGGADPAGPPRPGVEPGADLGPSRLRQGIDQFHKATRLDLRDRHQLPAAGAAAGAAGDPLAPRLQCFRHAVLHGLGQHVEDRQDRAGGHGRPGNCQGELDLGAGEVHLDLCRHDLGLGRLRPLGHAGPPPGPRDLIIARPVPLQRARGSPGRSGFSPWRGIPARSLQDSVRSGPPPGPGRRIGAAGPGRA